MEAWLGLVGFGVFRNGTGWVLAGARGFFSGLRVFSGGESGEKLVKEGRGSGGGPHPLRRGSGPPCSDRFGSLIFDLYNRLY